MGSECTEAAYLTRLRPSAPSDSAAQKAKKVNKYRFGKGAQLNWYRTLQPPPRGSGRSLASEPPATALFRPYK